jgi:hypothetical protein
MRTDLKAKSIRAHQFTVGDRPVLISKNQSSLIRDAAGKANLAVRRRWLTIGPDVVLATNRFLARSLSQLSLRKKIATGENECDLLSKYTTHNILYVTSTGLPDHNHHRLIRARPWRWAVDCRYEAGHSDAAPDEVDPSFTGVMPTRWRSIEAPKDRWGSTD